ncbi:unnamed protein product [Blepharisma stoltei]|uniref:Uncharacterized protein n=1 Tax=Blepharisma stoltei TaxID=1481888 RepID=A0AAU9I9G7_9CILI|nr:unnamed protein product [Blepharisma stoltei]
MALSATTEDFYNTIIENVLDQIKRNPENSSLQETTLQNFKSSWLRNLNQIMRPPVIRHNLLFANPKISKPKKNFPKNEEYFKSPAQKQEQEIKNPPIPQIPMKQEVITKPQSDSESSNEDEEESDEEQNEAELEFQKYKNLGKNAQEIEPSEEEEEEEDLGDISDEDTNILIPETKDVMYCSYDKVARTGDRWKVLLKRCVLKMGRSKEFFYHRGFCDVDFEQS